MDAPLLMFIHSLRIAQKEEETIYFIAI